MSVVGECVQELIPGEAWPHGGVVGVPLSCPWMWMVDVIAYASQSYFPKMA